MENAIKIMNENKRCKMWAFNTTQTINGMKMTKCYKAHRIGRDAVFTSFDLCLIRAERDGQTAWAGRSTGMGVVDSFSHNGQVSVKQQQSWYEYYLCNPTLRSTGKADPYAVVRCQNYNSYMFKEDSRIETLANSGDVHDKELLAQIIEWEKPLPKHVWSAYKVAKRHGYDFQGEMWRWIMLVNLLRMNKRDYRNPVYVCPKNLVETCSVMIDVRDKALIKERARRMEEERMRIIEEDKKALENFIRNKSRYFGIAFGEDNINISVLDSIEAYKEEGNAMDHCVFSASYWKKDGTLILSARNSNGKRLATIELSLKNWQVLQCRGKHNSTPRRYDEIVNLVNKNVWQFQHAKPLTMAS